MRQREQESSGCGSAADHGVRIIKDKISRDILPALDKAKIGIASATYEIVGVPLLTIDQRGNAKA